MIERIEAICPPQDSKILGLLYAVSHATRNSDIVSLLLNFVQVSTNVTVDLDMDEDDSVIDLSVCKDQCFFLLNSFHNAKELFDFFKVALQDDDPLTYSLLISLAWEITQMRRHVNAHACVLNYKCEKCRPLLQAFHEFVLSISVAEFDICSREVLSSLLLTGSWVHGVVLSSHQESSILFPEIWKTYLQACKSSENQFAVLKDSIGFMVISKSSWENVSSVYAQEDFLSWLSKDLLTNISLYDDEKQEDNVKLYAINFYLNILVETFFNSLDFERVLDKCMLWYTIHCKFSESGFSVVYSFLKGTFSKLISGKVQFPIMVSGIPWHNLIPLYKMLGYFIYGTPYFEYNDFLEFAPETVKDLNNLPTVDDFKAATVGFCGVHRSVKYRRCDFGLLKEAKNLLTALDVESRLNLENSLNDDDRNRLLNLLNVRSFVDDTLEFLENPEIDWNNIGLNVNISRNLISTVEQASHKRRRSMFTDNDLLSVTFDAVRRIGSQTF